MGKVRQRYGLRHLVAMAGLLVLGGCATAAGYQQHMDLLVGQTTDQLQIQWGVPAQTSALSDGSEFWVYHRVTESHSGGYWTNKTRSRTETYKDEKGVAKERTVTYSEPYFEPPVTTRSYCETRFVIGGDHRVKSVSFEGDGCVAEEIEKKEG